MADYTAGELRDALASLGIEAGDTVYCHSNVGLFGRAEGAGSADALCEMFLDAIMARIGPGGTLIVPTYTYSFSGGQNFDVAATASKMGLFAEWIRRHPDSVRSPDPCYSVAVVGRDPQRFGRDLPNNSFSPGSTFDRFTREDGKILCLNHPGCTVLHFFERELGVPYRFDKEFDNEMTADGVARRLSWKIWVRYLSDDLLAHDPWPYVDAIKQPGRARWRQLGRGEALAIGAQQAFSIVRDGIAANPWFLTKGFAADRTPVIDQSRR
jgi:aminoglycoside 3-N-acetyltransferase